MKSAIQECPSKSLKEALMYKIKEDENDNGDKTFLIGL
jgi:hypothetical protein